MAIRAEELFIDYLKFVVPMDHDRGQMAIANIKEKLAEQDVPVLKEGANLKITVLDSTANDPGRRRYCVESWGPASHYLASIVPFSWFEHLNRIDYRTVLRCVGEPQLAAWIDEKYRGKAGRRNVTTFNTKPRTKSHSRDVGGRGITFGSRKSDSHTVVYQRGDEMPTIEMRFQGRKAEELGNVMLQKDAEGALSDPLTDLRLAGLLAVSGEMWTVFGASEIKPIEAQMVHAEQRARQVQAAMEWIETEAERTYTETTTTEEQEQDQRERWVPTSLFNGPRIK